MVLNDPISVEDARAKILLSLIPLSTERVNLDDAYQRVLAKDIVSSFDFPIYRTSSMDGYAVRRVDIRTASHDHPVQLDVIEEIPAGIQPQKEILPGQCARIMTGALVPNSADAVVPVEWTGAEVITGDDLVNQVDIYQPAPEGAFIRPTGQDIKAGETLVQTGTALEPHHLALLATVGTNEITAYRVPRVAIISSGSELITPGQPLQPGKIYNANAYGIKGLVNKYHCEPLDLGIATDDPGEILSCFDRAVAFQADLIISSAGVSVGGFDFIRPLLEQHGTLEFWRVNMRPGKPLAYGSYRSIPVVGLPGNPVSAFIDFLVFVVPALEHLKGNKGYKRAYQRGTLTETVESDGRESYFRVVSWIDDGQLKCKLTGHQGSGNIYSLVQANALLIVPSGVKSLPAGSNVELWMLE